MYYVFIVLAFVCLVCLNIVSSVSGYNKGYKDGMLYAYDDAVVCGANVELKGLELARELGRTEISTIECR